jgi:hypothetical protein
MRRFDYNAVALNQSWGSYLVVRAGSLSAGSAKRRPRSSGDEADDRRRLLRRVARKALAEIVVLGTAFFTQRQEVILGST